MMSGFLIWSALGIGFAGSFHCMGMCGPLAMGITMPGKAGQTPFASIGYFVGKTFTYGLLGLIFGFFGQQFKLAGMQQALSVTMGILMLLFVLFTIAKPALFHQNKFTNWVNNRLTPVFSILFKQRNGVGTPVLFGMLNGLLPCGLVYFGLTAAIATGDVYQSAVFMLLFGLGTMPVMFVFLFLSRQFGYRFRLFFLRATPYVMALLGVVLVLRGLDLGIPYISPVLESLSLAPDRHGEIIKCHP